MTPTDMSSPFGDPHRPLGLRLLLLVAALTAAGIGAWALTRDRPVQGSPEHAHASASAAGAMPVTLGLADQERIGVTFAPVEFARLQHEVRTVAQVTYDETRVKVIAPLVEGWVDRLFVNFTGQAVRTGQGLFTIYSPMVVAAQEELLLARRLERDVVGGTPDARRSAAELLAAARRRLRYWGIAEREIAEIESSGEIRRTVTLHSPWSGVVVDKPVLAGQRIMPGDVAYRIADLTRVWLEGEVFERDLAAVRMGLAVRAEFTALPGDVRIGELTYIYPTVDPETRTARIRVELPNPRLLLKPGMYATIRFAARSEPALSVPRSAVLSTGERHLLFVKGAEGQFIPRLVTLGSVSDDRVEILAGVAAGDTVVASGTFLVDAESNLGTLMGGMGNMPGMDLTAPAGPGGPPDPGPDSAGAAADTMGPMSRRPGPRSSPGESSQPRSVGPAPNQSSQAAPGAHDGHGTGS